MSMIEHAVGVVSLERFAEISHMSHDEMGSLLLDTMAENTKLRELLGDALHTLFYKRFDGRAGCTEHCPRWKYRKDCQLVDGCWLELEATKLGIEVEL